MSCWFLLSFTQIWFENLEIQKVVHVSFDSLCLDRRLEAFSIIEDSIDVLELESKISFLILNSEPAHGNGCVRANK